jgi:hypothetical protein
MAYQLPLPLKLNNFLGLNTLTDRIIYKKNCGKKHSAELCQGKNIFFLLLVKNYFFNLKNWN